MTSEEIITNGSYLAHFNHNHDPKNGQFAKKSGVGITQRYRESVARGNEKRIKRLEELRDKQAKTGRYRYAQNDIDSTIAALKTQNQKIKEENERKQNLAFNKKALKTAANAEKYSKRASEHYAKAMIKAVENFRDNDASKKNAGREYEKALKNHERMAQYIEQLEKMGVKYNSGNADRTNLRYVAAGQLFIKKALDSGIYEYRVNEEFIKNAIK